MVEKAVHLIKANPRTGKLELDEKPLRDLLKSERAQNCELAIISVAGLLRKGKSFLLSLFVRFLLNGSADNWLDNLDEKSEGFEWQNGSEAHTSGILIWPEIFYYKNSDDEEIGIILMDTQGCFDTKTTINENVSIFAFSTMLASVQIYNLMQLINENDLQNLQLFAEFGKNASQNSTDKPFQKLIFLIRDWSDKKNFAYGESGGQTYLERQLFQKNDKEELEMTRNSIKSCFQTWKCFLLPHPGLEVSQDFDGDLNKLSLDFREYVKQLVPFVLSRENIIVKEISGNQIKGKDFLDFVSSYWTVFKNGEMPEPKSVYTATVEATCNTASRIVQAMYTKAMDVSFESLASTDTFLVLLMSHNCNVDEANKTFNEKTKFGTDSLKKPFLDMLSKYFEECFILYTKMFEKRNASEEEKQALKDELQKLKDKSQNSKLVDNLSFLAATMTAMMVNPITGALLVGAGALLKLGTDHREEIANAVENLTETASSLADGLSDKYLTSPEDNINYLCKILREEYNERMDVILSSPDINMVDLRQSHNEYVDKAKNEFYANTDGIGEDLLKEQILEKLFKYFQDCFIIYVGILDTKDESDAEKQVHIDELQKLKESTIHRSILSTTITSTGVALTAVSPILGGLILGAGLVLNALETRRTVPRATNAADENNI